MGVLAFGLSTPRDLAIACGVLVAAWGPLQILIYLKVSKSSRNNDHLSTSLFTVFYSFLSFPFSDQWPEYFDHKEKYNPEASN